MFYILEKTVKIENSVTQNSTSSDHGHIITVDLRLMKNQKLRNLFPKSLNFSEPQSLNYCRCKKKMITLLRNLLEALEYTNLKI